MKKAKIIAVVLVIGVASALTYAALRPKYATCKGSDNCKACKNCKYCKYCAEDGGTCGVCNH